MILLTSLSPAIAATEKAVFAGGCFWCMQADFDKLPGVLSTTSGFDGGDTKNPSYELVSSGATNYAEALLIVFDSDKVSYQQLLDYFWLHIDPTTKDMQFCDHGQQYRSAIFYLNKTQQQLANASKEKLQPLFTNIYTQITPSTHFYPAEEYHQNYYKKNPLRYKYYRYRCGRDKRIQQVWHHETP